ncbi:MAG: fatty acyl-AMP ligase [Nocardiopsaceae bacterium]|nr:fatty acyl-AMP ligase [Nocardiopsaceae bacterium]
MSRFTDMTAASAASSAKGIVYWEQHGATRRSWGDVRRRAERMAADLMAEGLRPGAPVALLVAEPLLVASAVQAIWLAGGSVTMLQQPTGRTDLAQWSERTVRALDMIGSQLVLLGPVFEPVAPELASRGIRFRMLADLDDAAPDTTPGAAPGALPDAWPPPPSEDDTALLQLTSGSTAEPKAVRITHGNLLANIMTLADTCTWDAEEEVLMSWLPLFHDMGMIVFLLAPMMFGLEVVTISPADFLADPMVWPRLLSEYQATITGGPNFGYALAARAMARAGDAERLDLSALRIATCGAEPIDEAAIRRFTEAGARFSLSAGCFMAAYGMAEATVAVSISEQSRGLKVDVVDATQLEEAGRAVPCRPGDGARTLARLGAPLPGLEVGVIDQAGTPAGERVVGELRVRGTSVSPGYLTADGPLATVDAHGWFRTGDLGYLADGEVVVCGRIKDVIIMGGRNIYPTDIERVVTAVDGVRAGNAVAIRLDVGTGRERFAVAAESKRAGDEEAERLLAKEITARVTDEIGARPAEVLILPPGSLPKTSSGKLQRAAAARLLPLP